MPTYDPGPFERALNATLDEARRGALSAHYEQYDPDNPPDHLRDVPTIDALLTGTVR